MVRYFGLRKQTAFDAPAAPNRFIDVLSANPNPSDERMFPPSLASRETTLWLPGRKYSEPELECYLFPEGLEGLFHSFFQSVTTTTLDATNNVYRHEFKPAPYGTELTYYTWEMGFDEVTALRIPNVVVNTLSISMSADEPPTLSVSAVGGFPATAPLATSITYPSVRQFINSDISVTVADVPAELIELEVEFNNNLDPFHDLTATMRGIDLSALEVSGRFSARFRTAEHLNRFLSADETSLNITLTGPVAGGTYNYQLEIDMPRIAYEAWAGEIRGGERLVQDINFRALKPATGNAVVLRLTNKVAEV